MILGAALTYSDVQFLRDWLFDADRPLEIQDFVPIGVCTDPQNDLVAAYKDLLRGYAGPVGVHGPFWGIDLANVDVEIGSIMTQRLLTSLAKAEAVGATQMVVHSPFDGFHEWNRWNYPDTQQMITEACVRILTPVLQRARDIGCMLVLENVMDVNPDSRRTLCQELGTDVIRVSVDTGHAAFAHTRCGAPSVTDFIASAGSDLAHVHLQDSDGHADRHWHPGEGILPWGGIFRAIHTSGSDPRLILEVRDRRRALPETAERLSQTIRLASL